MPRAVAWLGHGGLLPFIGLAALVVLDRAHAAVWSDALAGYGAVILSFVGALHWGVAMSAPALTAAQRQQAFAWSVVPALLAWPATVFAGSAASVLLVLGFAAHLAQDHRLATLAELPAWYLPLRVRLTAVACMGLLVNAGVAAFGGALLG